MASFSPDVLIVGAGIAGASLAYQLATQGQRVLLIERESQPGYHATGRSAAMFMPTYGPPGVRALTRASHAFYAHPPANVSPAPVVSPRGVMYVAGPGQTPLLHVMHAELAPLCPALQWWEAPAVLACVPCLRPEQVEAALFDPTGLDVDVNALHQGLLRGMRQAAGVLRTRCALQNAQRQDGLWHGVLSDGSTVRTPWLVNAAGAWADEVARCVGAQPVGLVPKRRSAFTFSAPPGADTRTWPTVVGADERYYFKPDAGQLLGSPANADPTVPHDVMPEEWDIAVGIHHIEQVSRLTIRRPSSTWAGLRTFAADGELVIGPDTRLPGFFWLAGQGGYGIQSAAGAAVLAASLLMHTPLPPEWVAQGVEPSVFSPARLQTA